MTNTRKGWRAFKCPECNNQWEWPTRDRFSPSGENCLQCGEWVFPFDCREDESLETDKYGNLIIQWNATPESLINHETV